MISEPAVRACQHPDLRLPGEVFPLAGATVAGAPPSLMSICHGWSRDKAIHDGADI